MTSQLNVDTIVDKAGSGGTNVKIKGSNSTYVDGTTTQNLASGVVKMFANINDSGAAIRKSFNVASYTDEATGIFITNYTNSFSDAVYVTTCGIRDGGGEDDTRMIVGSTSGGYYATGSQRNYAGQHNASTNGQADLNDAEYAMLASVGDLA